MVSRMEWSSFELYVKGAAVGLGAERHVYHRNVAFARRQPLQTKMNATVEGKSSA